MLLHSGSGNVRDEEGEHKRIRRKIIVKGPGRVDDSGRRLNDGKKKKRKCLMEYIWH